MKNESSLYVGPLRVCHVGTLPFERMGTLTHLVFEGAAGRHRYVTLDEELPDAEVYVLECFKDQHWRFRDFRPNRHGRVVSFIHSSPPCEPCARSDAVVCLTDRSASDQADRSPVVPLVIPGAVAAWSSIPPALGSRHFGRITRNAAGKFHPAWERMLDHILTAVPESSCTLFVDRTNEDTFTRDRLTYDTSVGMHDLARKCAALATLGLAVFAHGDFQEVFPMAVLECMAAGLPVVYTYQPSTREMVGDSQYCCSSGLALQDAVVDLLRDEPARRALGARARARAQEFTAARMLERWDGMLRGLS